MMEDSTITPFNLSTSLHITMIEGETLAERIAAERAPGEDNFRKIGITFSGDNSGGDKKFRESVVSFSDANPVDTANPYGSSSGSTTRTVVVDATKHLEAGSTSSGNLIPGVNDVTKGMQDVVRSAKHCVKIFRIDTEIFEVNEEQLDRVRMSKCDLEGVGEKTEGLQLRGTARRNRIYYCIYY
jgi:hypothetical protein